MGNAVADFGSGKPAFIENGIYEKSQTPLNKHKLKTLQLERSLADGKSQWKAKGRSQSL
jgi:hypothetical protein